MNMDSKSGSTEKPKLDKSGVVIMAVTGGLAIVVTWFLYLNNPKPVTISRPPDRTVLDLPVLSSNKDIVAFLDKENQLILLRMPARTNFYYDLIMITDPEKKSGFLLGTITNSGVTTNIEFRVSTDIFQETKNPNFHIAERPITLEPSAP